MITMKENNNGVTGFQAVAYLWLSTVVIFLALASWHSTWRSELANVSFLSYLSLQTPMFLAVFGICLVGILKAQNNRINAQNMRISDLEEKLLRLTTPSPFAHASRMTNDE
jgi:hypothetical protein